MDTEKIVKRNCRIIAHRGASSLERENTCAAFVAAGNRSYYGIETDVHVTRDGKFIICHDHEINRVTGLVGDPVVIEETDFEELKKHNILDLDGSPRSDLVFPTLSDYISICRKYDKVAVLELKGLIAQPKLEEIAALIEGAGWLNKTTFISFYMDDLIGMRKILGGQNMQFLSGEPTDEHWRDMQKYRLGADFGFWSVTPEWIKRVHGEGLEFNCWTVDAASDAEKMMDLGVDFITSNRLE